jgi:hypothetical protein
MNTTDPRWNTDGKWRDMTSSQKLAFLGKLMVALCTWGFVFPNILD